MQYHGLIDPRRRRPAPRKGDWMQTFTGRQFWPLDPRPEDFDIADIAVALSRVCRYGGHCARFYSVAEHCVHMTRAARGRGYNKRDQRTALLHDASEAYLADLTRAVKRGLPDYRALESAIMAAVAARYDIDWPVPAHVKDLDELIIADEAAQNMAPPPAPWRHVMPLGVTLQCLWPDQALVEFMTELRLVGVTI